MVAVGEASKRMESTHSSQKKEVMVLEVMQVDVVAEAVDLKKMVLPIQAM